MAQKVCPRCSVLSDTDADACPNCGAAYARGGRPGLTGLNKALIALAVVAIAGAGAVIATAGGDDDPSPKAAAKATPTAPPPHSIVFSQAAGIRAKTPYAQVIASLGTPRPDLQGTQKRYLGQNRCIYYDLIDQPQTDAQVCFRGGRVTVVAVNYPGAPPQDPNARKVKPKHAERQSGKQRR